MGLTQVVSKVALIADVTHEIRKDRGGYVQGAALIDTVVSTVDLLNRAGLEFAIAGGFAYGRYSAPRATSDLDLVLSAPIREVEKVLTGAGYENKGKYDFKGTTIHKFKLGEIEVDVLEFPAEFQKAMMTRAESGDIFGKPIKVISLEDLIICKLIAFRPKDKRDIEQLVEDNPGYNKDYVSSWAQDLRIFDRTAILG